MSSSTDESATSRIFTRDLGVYSPVSQGLLTRFDLVGVVLAGSFTGTLVATPMPAPTWAATQDRDQVRRVGWTGDELGSSETDWLASYAVSGIQPRFQSTESVDQEPSTEWARKLNASRPVVPADLVRRLRGQSGLTWEQLAKLFGVSRRAVHLWAAGGRMNAANHEQLARLVSVVDGLPGRTPDQRRAALLTPRETGTSLYDRLRAAHASGEHDVAGTPWSSAELLHALGDSEEV